MREEQFDHIENRIREAAENSRPDFDDAAWVKMEALLDADKKRRPVIWLWFLLPALLLGAGAIYLFSGHDNSKAINHQKIAAVDSITSIKPKESVTQDNTITSTQPKESSSSSANTIAAETPTATTTISSSKDSDRSNSETVSFSRADKKTIKTKTDKSTADNVSLTQHTSTKAQHKKNKLQPTAFKNTGNITAAKKISYTRKGKIKTSVVAGTADDTVATSNKTIAGVSDKMVDKTATNVDAIITKTNNTPADTIAIAKATNDKNDSPQIAKKKDAVEKKQKKIVSNFYLLGVAGADNANVKLLSFTNSQTTPKLGIGIGYQFGKRLSVQTGFYTSHKKYVAGSDDYTLKPNPYWAGAKIIKVDGDCKVYEIPLQIRYDIAKTKKMNYYAVVGISSYIMKKEDYNYHYTQYYRYYSNEYGYTGNKSLFSVLTFAAGIERKLSEKFYLQAEPAIAIPLAGVGDGKVKLYSSSLVLGLRYFPFKRK